MTKLMSSLALSLLFVPLLHAVPQDLRSDERQSRDVPMNSIPGPLGGPSIAFSVLTSTSLARRRLSIIATAPPPKSTLGERL